MPGRPAVEDGDGLAAGVSFDSGLVALVRGNPPVTELSETGEVEVGDGSYRVTVGE